MEGVPDEPRPQPNVRRAVHLRLAVGDASARPLAPGPIPTRRPGLAAGVGVLGRVRRSLAERQRVLAEFEVVEPEQVGGGVVAGARRLGVGRSAAAVEDRQADRDAAIAARRAA